MVAASVVTILEFLEKHLYAMPFSIQGVKIDIEGIQFNFFKKINISRL